MQYQTQNLNTPTKDCSCWEALLEKWQFQNVLSHIGSKMYPDLGHSAIHHCFRNQITFISNSFFLMATAISVIFCLYQGSYSVSMLCYEEWEP